jgi:T5SS/PEP-CTERM-associated repeat protein
MEASGSTGSTNPAGGGQSRDRGVASRSNETAWDTAGAARMGGTAGSPVYGEAATLSPTRLHGSSAATGSPGVDLVGAMAFAQRVHGPGASRQGLPGDDAFRWTGSGTAWSNKNDWYDITTRNTGQKYPVNGDVVHFDSGAVIDDTGVASDIYVASSVSINGSVGSSSFLGVNGQIAVSGQLSASGGPDTAVFIGQYAAGALIVQGGGRLDVANTARDVAVAGVGLGSTGTLTITGMGSNATADNGVGIGILGTGYLNILAGATMIIAAQDPTRYGAGGLGALSGVLGVMTVSGAGSVLTANAGGFFIGASGRGEAVIAQGGKFIINDGNRGLVLAGDGTAAAATLSVTGAGSAVTVNDNGPLSLGDTGTADMTVLNSGLVSVSGTITVGVTAGSHGHATVTGAGSVLKADGDLTVGDNGQGVVTVMSGGYLASHDVVLAFETRRSRTAARCRAAAP